MVVEQDTKTTLPPIVWGPFGTDQALADGLNLRLTLPH
jgi:hypothetical protein